MSSFAKIIRAYKRWQSLRKEPLRLEFVVTDWCNLNCVGCTHYSPLAKKEFADKEVLKKSIETLGEKCATGIDSAYLIGGETLLYPHIKEIMPTLRKSFPTQTLYIFTNGLPLPKMDDEFWEIARDQKFTIALTRYPVKFDYDAVIELCKKQGVKVEVFGDRSLENSFFRFALDPTKSQNGKMAHFKCYNRGCISVIGNKIYPCSISGCISNLNKAHGTNFTHEKGDFIFVDEVKNVNDIKRLRDKAVPFCGYCIVPPSEVKYGPSKRALSEWVDTK